MMLSHASVSSNVIWTFKNACEGQQARDVLVSLGESGSVYESKPWSPNAMNQE